MGEWRAAPALDKPLLGLRLVLVTALAEHKQTAEFALGLGVPPLGGWHGVSGGGRDSACSPQRYRDTARGRLLGTPRPSRCAMAR